MDIYKKIKFLYISAHDIDTITNYLNKTEQKNVIMEYKITPYPLSVWRIDIEYIGKEKNINTIIEMLENFIEEENFIGLSKIIFIFKISKNDKNIISLIKKYIKNVLLFSYLRLEIYDFNIVAVGDEDDNIKIEEKGITFSFEPLTIASGISIQNFESTNIPLYSIILDDKTLKYVNNLIDINSIINKNILIDEESVKFYFEKNFVGKNILEDVSYHISDFISIRNFPFVDSSFIDKIDVSSIQREIWNNIVERDYSRIESFGEMEIYIEQILDFYNIDYQKNKDNSFFVNITNVEWIYKKLLEISCGEYIRQDGYSEGPIFRNPDNIEILKENVFVISIENSKYKIQDDSFPNMKEIRDRWIRGYYFSDWTKEYYLKKFGLDMVVKEYYPLIVEFSLKL